MQQRTSRLEGLHDETLHKQSDHALSSRIQSHAIEFPSVRRSFSNEKLLNVLWLEHVEFLAQAFDLDNFSVGHLLNGLICFRVNIMFHKNFPDIVYMKISLGVVKFVQSSSGRFVCTSAIMSFELELVASTTPTASLCLGHFKIFSVSSHLSVLSGGFLDVHTVTLEGDTFLQLQVLPLSSSSRFSHCSTHEFLRNKTPRVAETCPSTFNVDPWFSNSKLGGPIAQW